MTIKFKKVNKTLYESQEYTLGSEFIQFLIDTKGKLLMLRNQHGIFSKEYNLSYKAACRRANNILKGYF